MKKLLFIGIATLALSACDKINDPIPGGGTNPIDTTTVLRKVLLEDFTGHHCVQCPAASLKAQELHGVYNDQLVIVALHANRPQLDGFTAPRNNLDGSYATDFRTEAASDYAQQFSVGQLPNGMISRKEFENSITMSHGSWGPAVAEIINEPASFRVKLDNVAYDGGNSTISTTVELTSLEEQFGDFSCTIYLVEDHIIDWQLNGAANPPDVPDYDHRHVHRDNLNGSWGDNVFSGNLTSGQYETVTITNFSVDPAWNMDNGYIVAYVYNTDTYEVMQVDQVKIIP